MRNAGIGLDTGGHWCTQLSSAAFVSRSHTSLHVSHHGPEFDVSRALFPSFYRDEAKTPEWPGGTARRKGRRAAADGQGAEAKALAATAQGAQAQLPVFLFTHLR